MSDFKESGFSFGELFGKEGFSPEETRKADEAEAMQRLHAAGIEPKTPNEAIILCANFFGSFTTVEEFAEALDKLTDEEQKQWLYLCHAASHGARNIGNAIMCSIMKRKLEGLPGFGTEDGS